MDQLDRLRDRLLVSAAELDQGVCTIGEVYQRLVPYRAVRGELGLWELAEYEHTLLRLLAGERDYVVVVDRAVREEFNRELASPNPILGIYRDYAPVELRITGLSIPPDRPQPRPPATDRRVCTECGFDLPADADLRYCPSCGTEQLEARCRSCEAPLKPEWNFCIRCGRPRGTVATDPSR